ncbi:hypothetical protein NM208_g9544 [Fusarium decemcellulare]|uniref:Uncharacterized protein n=1 Tax=Fusarium decemcellulare TaxID=57161 RepID=A0ACC1S1G7_9HYPO|nr:hypothetical protein NM208_g9544 [Fusarium decemcellulare]
MASPTPAPSRAAIHALRGVLLTTSCSVIILAEERRRRLNIARAAIDNAKKLHTARVHHNSAALAESFGRREAFPVEIAHDFSPVPAPKNPVRRRRRQVKALNEDWPSAKETQALNNFEASVAEDAISVTTPEDRQRKWDEWDAARKELSWTSDTSSLATNTPLPRIPPRDRPSLDTPFKQERNGASSDIRTAKDSDNSTTFKSSLLRATFVGDGPGTTLSLTELDVSLAGLESPELSHARTLEQLDKSTEILRKLISSQSEEPQLILSRGIRLLQSTVSSREYSRISHVLDAVQPVCTDVCLLTVPCVDRLFQAYDTEGARQLLKQLSQHPICTAEALPYRLRNGWVSRLLMHYWRRSKNFAEVQAIYNLLQEDGVLLNSFPLAMQYAVRRRIALIALDAGDDARASEEMAHLCRLRPKASDLDVKLRGRFVVRDAELGLWDRVWAQLDTFKLKAKHSPQFQNVLSWITKIYCQDHSPAEIDVIVRDLVKRHQMTLSKTLAFLVMDRHGRNHDLQAFVRWLRFCQDGGLEVDQIFFNEVADKCCKYWNLGRVDVVGMLKDAQSYMPWLQEPLLATYSSNGALHDLHKRPLVEQEDTYGIVSALPESRGDSASIFERTAFRHMNTLALQNDWVRVCAAYGEATEKGLGFSVRCLRLAIVANIHLEGPHSCTASKLIGKAHADGHDTSGALVPWLLSRLEGGDNVGDLLQEALSKGQRVHDSVYNKAARILVRKGRPEAASKVCEIAAQQNGMGELAYSKFNFATLVHTYTGQRRYEDLHSLITCFTSKSEWWQGSKECKESIKLAMKTLAARATKGLTDDKEAHEEALMHLNDALQHIKSLRAKNRQEQHTLTKEVAGILKPAEEPPAFDGGFFPDPQVERLVARAKSYARDASIPRDAKMPTTDKSRSTEHDDLAQNNKFAGVRTIQEKSRRETTSSPELSEQEEMFLERQSLAAAL